MNKSPEIAKINTGKSPCFDIVGIGMAVFDSLMLLEDFPAEDEKVPCAAEARQGGGPCSTALVAAARMGAVAAFVGVLGTDAFSRFILDDMARFGVDTRHVRTLPGALPGHSSVLVNAKTGSRTVVWSAGTLPETAPDDVPAALVQNAKILHLDNHHMAAALHAARLAKAAGVMVSLDAGSVYPGCDELLPLVDILIPSQRFILQYTGCTDAEKGAAQLYAKYRPQMFAATLGAAGGLVHTGEGFEHYAAFHLPVVDTNGAGDVFHGAFLAGWLRGMAPPAAARFASAAAALSCRALGARAALPTFNEALVLAQSTPG